MALLLTSLLVSANVAAKQTFVVSPDPATSRLVLETPPGEKDIEHVLIKNVAGFDVLLKITLQPRLTDDIWVFSLPNGNEYKLPANETIRVPVQFAPYRAGRYEDVLAIVDEFGYGVRLKVLGESGERCIVRQPAEVKLGPTPVGERACQTIQIANPTTDVIVVRDIALESHSDEFSIHEVPELPARIEPGEYIKIVACYKPTEYVEIEKALVRTTYYCANTATNSDAKVAETILYGIGDANLCRMKVRELIELSAPAGEKVCEKLVVYNGNRQVIILGEIKFESNGELELADMVTLPIRIEPGQEVSVGAVCYKPDGSMPETKGRISYTYLCENAEHRQYVSTIVHGALKRDHCILRQTESVAFRPSRIEECKEVKMANTGDQSMRVLEISIVRTTGDWKLRLPEIPFGLEPGDVKVFGVCHLPTGATLNSACLIRTVYLCANSDRKQEVFTKAYITPVTTSDKTASGRAASSRAGAAISIGGDQEQLEVEEDALPGLAIMPNPATTNVRITGLANSTVEIYDMLGRQVNVFTSVGDLSWNCRDYTGNAVPNGAYIVRITGIAHTGSPFVLSKRLIIER
jgi:hypothetical protein